MGNTLSAAGRTFNFDTSQATHSLTVEYVNLYEGPNYPPDPGGSYYNLSLNADPVPLPPTVLLLGFGVDGPVGAGTAKEKPYPVAWSLTSACK